MIHYCTLSTSILYYRTLFFFFSSSHNPSPCLTCMHAEFAKEAMTCQTLDHEEILSIRWAHDDPNPVAKQSIERADKDAVVSLLQSQGVSLAPAAFEYPPEYALPAPKRLRAEEGGDVVSEEYPELSYPNTDAQYSGAGASGTGTVSAGNDSSTMSAEEYKAYCENYFSHGYEAQKQAALSRLGIASDGDGAGVSSKAAINDSGIPSGVVNIVGKKRSAGADSADGDNSNCSAAASNVSDSWAIYKDESSGAMYYFNSSTGESTWTTPAGM